MALHMSTIISRNTSEIVSHLSRVRTAFSSHIPLFTLSAASDGNASDISVLVSQLASLSTHSVGCLSARIPSPDPALQGCIACSVAVFDSSITTVFRSTIPGRQAPQVGRWHAFRKRDEGDLNAGAHAMDRPETLDWEDIWARKNDMHEFPPELSALEADQVNTVIYLSDGSPEGLSNALDEFPSATKLGLIASSTPFITGRPYTLFSGSSIHSSGAVGVCITSQMRPRMRLNFPGLLALTSLVTVTESEGNLIQTLDNANPSRLLLSAIERTNKDQATHDRSTLKKNITKDDLFYMAVLRDSHGEQEVQQLYHITSGDPSRGTLALESELAPSIGTRVQIFRLPVGMPPDTLSQYLPSPQDSASQRDLAMCFTVAAPDLLHSTTTADGEGRTVVIPDTFLTASENGFMVGRYVENAEARERPWLCNIPGGLADLRWRARQ